MTTLKERIDTLTTKLRSQIHEAEGGFITSISKEELEALLIITQQQEAIQIMREALEDIKNWRNPYSGYYKLSVSSTPSAMAKKTEEALEKTNKILEE